MSRLEILEARALLNGVALDPHFGNQGQATVPAALVAADVAVLPDGRIVLAGRGDDGMPADDLGDFAVTRLKRDGKLDASFGRGGTVLTSYDLSDFFQNDDRAASILPLPDGTLAAVGIAVSDSDNNLAVVHYGRNGEVLGKTFASHFGQNGQFGDALLLPDGKILVAGTHDPGLGRHFSVLRLTGPSTTLDTTFRTPQPGQFGLYVDNPDEDVLLAHAVAVQKDGKILVGGSFSNAADEDFLAVARLNSDGRLDTTFGNKGWLLAMRPGEDDNVENLAVQPDGCIVIDTGSALLRYHSSGQPDTDFGQQGQVVHGGAVDLALQNDGRILALGAGKLTRYTSDGRLDATFGTNGVIAVSDADDLLALGSRGEIVTLGNITGGLSLRKFVPDAPRQTPLAWGRKVSPAFRTKLRDISAELGLSPDHLMALMAYKTRQSFNPAFVDRAAGNATGLIQFRARTARRMGTTLKQLRQMSAKRQLDVVRQYLLPYRNRLANLEDVCMAVLAPRAVGARSDTVLFRQPATLYWQNRSLDANRDGIITKGEAAAPVWRQLARGQRARNAL